MVRIGPKLVGGRRGGRGQTFFANLRRTQDPVLGTRATMRNYESPAAVNVSVRGSSAGVSESSGIQTGSSQALAFHRFYVKGSGTEDGVATGDYCDGTRVAFTLNNGSADVTPAANSLIVTINGQLYREGAGKDYTVSGAVITFTDPPQATAELYGLCAIEEVTT